MKTRKGQVGGIHGWMVVSWHVWRTVTLKMHEVAAAGSIPCLGVWDGGIGHRAWDRGIDHVYVAVCSHGVLARRGDQKVVSLAG